MWYGIRRFSALLALLAASLTAAAGPACAHGAKDVVDRVWTFLGGKDTYQNARYVDFIWAYEKSGDTLVARHHMWDRYTGDYVLRMEDRESGAELAAYFNVDTRKGTALKNGVKLDGDAAAAALDRAYGIFINDTYWLLAPTKLEDYGTRLRFDSHEPSATGQLLVLGLAFDNVGLTPGDKYWFYVTGKGRIVKWRFVLENGHEGEYAWTDVKDCGMGLRFCTRMNDAHGGSAIIFPRVHFSHEMDPAAFSAP